MTRPLTAGVPSLVWLAPLACPQAGLSQSTDSALMLAMSPWGHARESSTDPHKSLHGPLVMRASVR